MVVILSLTPIVCDLRIYFERLHSLFCVPDFGERKYWADPGRSFEPVTCKGVSIYFVVLLSA